MTHSTRINVGTIGTSRPDALHGPAQSTGPRFPFLVTHRCGTCDSISTNGPIQQFVTAARGLQVTRIRCKIKGCNIRRMCFANGTFGVRVCVDTTTLEGGTIDAPLTARGRQSRKQYGTWHVSIISNFFNFCSIKTIQLVLNKYTIFVDN